MRTGARWPVGRRAADDLLSGRSISGRDCFHYLPGAGRAAYAREARRVLRPGGRFLLRACRTAAGVPTGIDAALLKRVFRDWRIDSAIEADIASDTRGMPAVVARMGAVL